MRPSNAPVSAKLHYTDTVYGHVVHHHQRTSSQQFYDLSYNKFTTNGQKFATSQHLDMSRCWALALRCGKFGLSVGEDFVILACVVLTQCQRQTDGQPDRS